MKIKVKWTPELIEEVKRRIEDALNGAPLGFTFGPDQVEYLDEVAPTVQKNKTPVALRPPCAHTTVGGICHKCGFNIFRGEYEW